MNGSLNTTTLHAARSRGGEWIAALSEHHPNGERAVVEALALASGLPAAGMLQMQQWVPLFDCIALIKAQARHCVLMRDAAGALPHDIGIVTDPWDNDLLTWITHVSARPVRFMLASPSDLHALLSQHEVAARAIDAILASGTNAVSVSDVSETLTLASTSESGSPAVKLVNSALYDALKLGASDIHIEATADGLAVKYRIDGVLDQVMRLQGIEVAEQVISRLKVLAELDIAERRVPQDGSFRVAAQGRPIDLRLSIMPSVHGEDAVVRVLDKHTMLHQHGRLTLDALGLDAATVASLRDMAEAAYGMVLVTGPTGSGKTTTLYALLSEMNTGRDKIITIEDPVEYQISGVLQIPVNDKKGLTFARGLRSILRHDPDKIMVGEIRDRETAEIAVQSALTGHMVLSTVHANSVYDVFGRFTHMGLDLYALASALNGIWAQRLIRMNCLECVDVDKPDESLLVRCGLDVERMRAFSFARGRGCGACRGTGYRGRHAVVELLRLSDAIREMIVAREPVRAIREAARSAGTRGLFESALDLVAQGRTTLEEVRRVTLSA
jgi:general secretion pathway protein E